MTDENLHRQQSEQTKRIERIVAEILGPKQHRITCVFSEGSISFRIDGEGEILLESYSPMPINEIEGLSDSDIENRLRKRFADTERFLNY